MNIYYELNDRWTVNGNRHWAKTGKKSQSFWHSIDHFKLAQHCDRIWHEDGNGVKFAKNRYTPLDTPVDMDEFVWIKLKSKVL